MAFFADPTQHQTQMTQELISRHCINSGIVVYQHDQLHQENNRFDYTALCNMIDFWKVMLVDGYGARPGQTILLDISTLGVYYYTAFFAAAELGMILIVDMPHAFSESDLNDYKINCHGMIDIVVSERKKYDVNDPQYNPWDCARNQKIGRRIIMQEDFDTYQIKDHSLYKDVAQKIFALPDQDLVWSQSSGTTGTPTRIVNSHRKVYWMSQRMAQHLQFTADQRVLHIRNLHHGASMCYYFLPSFMHSKHHYTMSIFKPKNIADLVAFTEQYQINRMFLYSVEFLNQYLEQVPVAQRDIEICALFATKEMLRLVKQKNIVNVKTLFGDTTIGIGMFVKTLSRDDNLDSYDPSDFGPALDDFYQFQLDDNGRLYVACDQLQESYRTSNDRFELINGHYHFRGRMHQHRIRGHWIDLLELEGLVQEWFGINRANIVLDKEYEKIYLAVWAPCAAAEKQLLEFIHQKYTGLSIDYVLRDSPYEHFFASRKIDNNKLRHHCRSRIIAAETLKL